MNTEFASEHERKEALVDYLMGVGSCPYTRDQMRQFVDIGEHAAQEAMETIARVCRMLHEPTIAVGIALRSMAAAHDSFVEMAKNAKKCHCLKCQLESAGVPTENIIFM